VTVGILAHDGLSARRAVTIISLIAELGCHHFFLFLQLRRLNRRLKLDARSLLVVLLVVLEFGVNLLEVEVLGVLIVHVVHHEVKLADQALGKAALGVINELGYHLRAELKEYRLKETILATMEGDNNTQSTSYHSLCDLHFLEHSV
jgi:hypothetical protein